MTRLALRRLAYRASRNPDWLPVFQDALHEAYPVEFAHALDVARRRVTMAHPDEVVAVVFNPSPLREGGHWSRRPHPELGPFDVFYLRDDDRDPTQGQGILSILARHGRVVAAVLVPHAPKPQPRRRRR